MSACPKAHYWDTYLKKVATTVETTLSIILWLLE